jgi:hypothetical protein
MWFDHCGSFGFDQDIWVILVMHPTWVLMCNNKLQFIHSGERVEVTHTVSIRVSRCMSELFCH